MNVKRFVLFGMIEYYTSGGWDDCMGSFDTYEEAVAHMNADLRDPDDPSLGNKNQYYHIIDLSTGRRVDF